MKISHGFIFVLVLFFWIMPCSAGNITYYDSHGNIVTRERYYEICRQRNKEFKTPKKKFGEYFQRSTAVTTRADKFKITSIELEAVNKDYIKGIELREQLQKFLHIYCQTFENKNLTRFTGFFTADAIEKGKFFNSLLPKYRKIFEIIDSIGYKIELKKYSFRVDTGTLEIQGKFYIKWLKHGTDRKNISGRISMSLIEHDNSYRIKQLDYNVAI